MKIAVVIPSISKHYDGLLKVIDAYLNGTVLPDQIVISLSDCENITDQKIQRLKQLSSIIKIIETPKILNRGDNRNKGANHVDNSIDLISFSDSDDIPHSQRIEVIKYLFETRPDVDQVLHTYILKSCVGKPSDHCIYCHYRQKVINEKTEFNLSELKIVEPFVIVRDNFPKFIRNKMVPDVKNVIALLNDGRQLNIPHGYPTIKRQVFEKVHYVPKYIRGQDSQFVQTVISKGFRTLVVDAELLIYNNEWIPTKESQHEITIPHTNGQSEKRYYDLGAKIPPKPAIARSPAEYKTIYRLIRTQNQRKVVSFSLYGTEAKYVTGMIKNAELVMKWYPGWHCHVYHDHTVPMDALETLRRMSHVHLFDMSDSMIPGMYWRFLEFDRKETDIFIVRDSDSRINERETLAVYAWLIDDKKIMHNIRDHPHHYYKIMGGLWGFKNWMKTDDFNLEKELSKWLKRHQKFTRMDDMTFLEQLYDRYQSKLLSHDDYFDPKYFPDAVLFPIPKEDEYYPFCGEIYEANDDRPYLQRDKKLMKQRNYLKTMKLYVEKFRHTFP